MWRGVTRNLPEEYPVHIVHYYNGSSRPWNLGCPLYFDEMKEFVKNKVSFASSVPVNVRIREKLPPVCSSDRDTTGRRVFRIHVLNEAPDILAKPGEHPFYPLRNEKIEAVSAPEDADAIFWHLHPGHVDKDYRELVYTRGDFFKAHEGRFVFYSTLRQAGVLYLNNAVSFTPFPCYSREINRLSRVISIPHIDPDVGEILDMPALLGNLQSEKKACELFHWSGAAGLVASGLDSGLKLATASSGLTASQLADMPADAKVRTLRDTLCLIARCRFYFHLHADAAAPYLIFAAMAMGVPPVILTMPEVPFSELADWSRMALMPQPGESLNAVLVRGQSAYDGLRTNGMAFYEEFARPDSRNDLIVGHYLRQYLGPVHVKRDESVAEPTARGEVAAT